MKKIGLIMVYLLTIPLGSIAHRGRGYGESGYSHIHGNGHASRVGMRSAGVWHDSRGYSRRAYGPRGGRWGCRGYGRCLGRRGGLFFGVPYYSNPYYYDYGIYGGPGFGLNLYI